MSGHAILRVMASATLCLGTMALAQQGGSANGSQDGYQGVSKPPQDAIETTPEQAPVIAKPPAGVLAVPPAQTVPQTNYTAPSYGSTAAQDGYQPVNSQEQAAQQALSTRSMVDDLDGDIVHPRATRPGELMEGSTIRVRLMDRLSSALSERGEPFHGQVASDVLQDGKVLIPAGSGIEGRVSSVTAGHLGGHGSFRLKPEAVILPDGSRYQLHAETTGTPGSKTRIGGEGSINPGSRAKKDGVEYGAVVGTGVVAGAVVGGPVGALTGGLIGAGIVTTHLMVDHPQATLEPGAVLLFTTTEPMNLMPATN
jgi:hypothetical protein